MSRDSLSKQISTNEESKQSALEGKILQFKKCLSASSDFYPSEHGNGLRKQSSTTSSGAHSSNSFGSSGMLTTSNPLSSLDCLASGN